MKVQTNVREMAGGEGMRVSQQPRGEVKGEGRVRARVRAKARVCNYASGALALARWSRRARAASSGVSKQPM